MTLKGAIKRGLVKTHRGIFGKPKEVIVTTELGGLTKAEIKDVLKTLATARRQGKIPIVRTVYEKPSFLERRQKIWLIPKTVSVPATRVKVKAAIRAKHGSRYIVR